MSTWFNTLKAETILQKFDRSRIVVFDVETTGFSPKRDELLQLTILDGNGTTLFDSYIKPSHRKTWKRAEVKNGISPVTVQNAPTAKEIKKEVQTIFDRALLLVGYNIQFDIRFLNAVGISLIGPKFDVMAEFVAYRSYFTRMPKIPHALTDCAEYFNENFTPHNSFEDADVTLRCFNHMISDPLFSNPRNKSAQKSTGNSRNTVFYGSLPNSYRTTKKHLYKFILPTPRYINEVIIGIVLLFVAEIMWIHYNSELIVNHRVYFSHVVDSIRQVPHFTHDFIPLVLIGLGCVLVIVGICKFVIWFPRFMISIGRKIVSLFK